MARFTAATESEAVVAAPRQDIWKVLTDPEVLPRLTPLLKRIDVDGDHWRWHMTGLSVLGVGISPVFTERMTFTDGRRIDYTHEPPRGVTETAGAEGSYELADVPGGTQLKIRLDLAVDLPLPSLARPAVRTVMEATMKAMGDRFSANLLRHLGISQPGTAERSRSGSR
jgi:carbon monoxide dehydrogenase subunit G